MFVLKFVVFVMAATVLAGSLVLTVLAAPGMGLDNATGVMGAAALGAALAIPVTVFVSKAIVKKMA